MALKTDRKEEDHNTSCVVIKNMDWTSCETYHLDQDCVIGSRMDNAFEAGINISKCFFFLKTSISKLKRILNPGHPAIKSLLS